MARGIRAEWSVWRALDEWRKKKRELDRPFAFAGVADDLDSALNRALVDLKRAPPTPPLVSGDTQFDEQEVLRYRQAFFRHYDESLYKIERALQMPWVPEMRPLAERVTTMIGLVRQQLISEPNRRPDLGPLETEVRHYLNLSHPELGIDDTVLAERRQLLADVAGFPLTVQHAQKKPLEHDLPLPGSSAFGDLLGTRIQSYLERDWLQCATVTQWYALLALDHALAHKLHDTQDRTFLTGQMTHRWPTLSMLLPDYAHADQLWYLVISCLTFFALFAEWWITGGVCALWLMLSIGAHRREKLKLEQVREHHVSIAATMKRLKSRFLTGAIGADRLALQLRQLDPAGRYYGEQVLALLRLSSQTA
ncbi:hypothetical protein ACTSKR_12915 [Chitinibacteraceae bacterium HSL-7]